MWEFQLSTSHGGRSTRSIVTYVLAALIAAFLWIVFVPHNTFAADAAWNGSSIKYENNIYAGPASEQTVSQLGLPKDTKVYSYVDPASASNRKIRILYFAPGVDPGTANGVNYREYDYKGPTSFANGSNPVAVTLPPQTANIGTSSCAVDGGLGWFICPVTDTLSGWMDSVFTILSSFLTVRPVQTGQENAMYRAWSYMRSIANIAFVIAFLIIIYSQLTNVGINNYNVKKMLPRLVIAAVLVNVSYIICSLAIDLSNVIGYGIQDIFIHIRNSLVGTEGNSWDVLSWSSISSFVLSGGAAAAAGGAAAFAAISTYGVGGAIVLLLPALVTAFVAVLVALLIMASRQALITILTIIAPLAFVAYLLPNTEKWFEKWRGTFMTMLILFPAFSIIFGGSQLAGSVIIQNADSINLIILGMMVIVAPLFITPMLIKFSGSLLGRIAGIANNPNKGVIDRTRNFAKDRSENIKARRLATPARPGIVGAAQRAGQRMDHARRRREGRRGAYNALSDGYFTQTQAGQDIAHMNHQAHFEKDEGEGRANEHWNQYVQSDPVMRARRIEQIRRQGTGDLYKAEVEAAGKEAFERTVQTSPGLTSLRIAQAGAEGRAKVYADNVSAQAEQALRAGIEGNTGQYVGIRNLELDTINRQGQAAIWKSRVEAEGKMAFRDAVLANRALRLAEVDTYEYQQRAELSEGIVKARAEANWKNLRLSDDGVRNRELERVRISYAVKEAEEKWNSLVQEIQARGGAASGISAADQSFADAIKRVQVDIDAEGKRQESFKVEQQQNLAQIFKTDETVRLHAGGDTEAGAARVYARAKKEISSGFMSTVDDIRSVISDYSLPELMRLAQEGKKRTINPDGTVTLEDATEAERMAAYQEVLLTKGNNWSAQKLKDTVAAEGMYYDDTTGKYYNTKEDMRNGVNEITDPDEIEQRRDRQQIFVDALKKSKLSIASVSGTDYGDMESGLFTNTTEDAIKRDIKTKKMKTQRWVSSDLDELQRMIQVLRDDDNRAELGNDANRDSLKSMLDTLENAFDNPDIYTQIDGRNLELMKVVQKYAENAYRSGGAPMTIDEKKNTEQGTATKVPTEYDPHKVYGWDDPKGPDGSW